MRNTEETRSAEQDGRVDAAAPGYDAKGAESTLEQKAHRVGPTNRLAITGHGLTFEREISEELALQVMKLVLTGGLGGDTGASVGGLSSDRLERGSDARKQSLAEFYRQAGPKKYPEKLVTIGAYLQDVVGRQSFTPDDLRAQFRSVNEPPPANMPRDVRAAIGEGWIADELDQPGEYYVTRSGLDAVRTGFSADGAPRSRSRRRRRSTKGAVAETPESGE